MSSRFPILARLAVRNLRKNVRRSLLTGAAMVVGVGLLAMSRAFAEGGHEDWIESGVRIGTGHIALQAPQFHARRTIEHRLGAEEVGAVLAALREPAVVEDALEVAVRLELQGLASSAAAAVPVMVNGVDPDVERRFAELDTALERGRYLEAGDRLHAYIGVKLAERLNLELGSRLVLTAQDASGEIAAQLVRVVGIFRTGLPEMDERFVQIPLETARAWVGTPEAATSVAVLLRSSHRVRGVRSALLERLASRQDKVRVLTWQEAMPALEAAVKVDDFGDYVFHVVTLVIVALAIVNTILMSVLHRTREFGVVRALGLTPRDTGTQVMVEGLVLSAVSGAIGIIVGFAVTWLFWRDGLDFSGMMGDGMRGAGVMLEPVFYPQFTPRVLMQSFTFVFAVGVLASLYPAYRATKIEIADAMKFEE
jgi:ABC-type lipoprotein release transport system permease subunit